MSSWRDAAIRPAISEKLGDLRTVQKGLSYKGAHLVDEGLPMVNMGNFGVDGKFREAGLKWYRDSEVRDKFRLEFGDLVIVNTDLTQSRDILARPIIVPFGAATSTHHTFQVKVEGGDARRFWIYCALRDETARRRLISFATGTTVAALPADALATQEIPWETQTQIDSWWHMAEPLFSAQLELRAENKMLAETRNELLPLLMSGRVRVGDVAA